MPGSSKRAVLLDAFCQTWYHFKAFRLIKCQTLPRKLPMGSAWLGRRRQDTFFGLATGPGCVCERRDGIGQTSCIGSYTQPVYCPRTTVHRHHQDIGVEVYTKVLRTSNDLLNTIYLGHIPPCVGLHCQTPLSSCSMSNVALTKMHLLSPNKL